MTKHALRHECDETGLQSGTYEVILPHDESFMVDGTMFINPGEQGLYHYRKQAGLQMKFKLIKAQQYHDLEEVQLEDVAFPLNDDDDSSDVIIVGQLEDAEYDEATISLDEDMSDSDKKTVNT